jgi:glycosyltransferase involved in cell wall biosynthesis
MIGSPLPNFSAKISDQFSDGTVAFHIVAVDDGSATPLDSEALALSFSSCIVELNVMVLALNLGHQRAIAAGLCALVERTDIDAVIVMDSDGEDRLEDVATLLAASRTHPAEKIVLARRTERSETRIFKIGYLAYRLLFRLLTGRAVAFGNFSLIPFTSLQRLVRLPELWNNLAAALMRSRMPYITVATRRGVRYFGQSRMNLTALVIHGPSAVVATTLMMLSNRSPLPIVPARDYSSFVLRMIEVKQLAVPAKARRDEL